MRCGICPMPRRVQTYGYWSRERGPPMKRSAVFVVLAVLLVAVVGFAGVAGAAPGSRGSILDQCKNLIDEAAAELQTQLDALEARVQALESGAGVSPVASPIESIEVSLDSCEWEGPASGFRFRILATPVWKEGIAPTYFDSTLPPVSAVAVIYPPYETSATWGSGDKMITWQDAGWYPGGSVVPGGQMLYLEGSFQADYLDTLQCTEPLPLDLWISCQGYTEHYLLSVPAYSSP